MSRDSSKSNNVNAEKNTKREQREHGLPTTPQSIKLPPVKQPKQPKEKK